jgi:hypothetical protein
VGASEGHHRVRGTGTGALDLRPAHEPHRHHGHRPGLLHPARRARSGLQFSRSFTSIIQFIYLAQLSTFISVIASASHCVIIAQFIHGFCCSRLCKVHSSTKQHNACVDFCGSFTSRAWDSVLRLPMLHIHVPFSRNIQHGGYLRS